MKRLVILASGVWLLGTACAGHGAVSLGKVPSPAASHSPAPHASKSHPSPTPTGAPTTSPSPSPRGTVTYQLWFAMGEKLFETKRTEPATLGVGTAAMKALLQGPTSVERADGVTTIIPSGTALNGLTISNGLATIDLTAVYASGGGSLSERFRLAQVVDTLTQFPTVKGVNFRLDGTPVTSFSSEGIVLDHPQTRADYRDLMPAITVDSPIVGQRMSSPVTVSGTANVFEATVSVWVLDANGARIAETFTNATCGTGCRGTYSVSVTYHVTHEQPGTVEVFEASAKDGSPTNVVKIPVMLSA
jgi:hypothetical protein